AASESNIDFQKSLKRTDGDNAIFSQLRHSSRLSNVAANKLNYSPGALQEVNNHLGSGTVENMRKKITKKKQGKKSNYVDRASHKWKSEDTKNLAVEKEETTTDTDCYFNLAVSDVIPVSDIDQKAPNDIERELVYTDEEDIPFEFAEPMVFTSTQSACHGFEKADAPSTSNSSALPRTDKQLQLTLQEGNAYYKQQNYAEAAERYSTALELCSKGSAIDYHFRPSLEDISSIISFIEAKLVICNLQLEKPDDALNHSYRSIILNPANYLNHLRQAAVFRHLERYSEAARSAMIADYMYWLTGGTEKHISNLIKQYWQNMLEEAVTGEMSFSVMYTPFVGEVSAKKLKQIKDLFAEKYPKYVQHIYTDSVHVLPQTAEWLSSPQLYLLTLGFRNKHTGKVVERCLSRKLPIFSDQKTPFHLPTKEETTNFWERTGERVVRAMDFIRSTKLTDNIYVCSRGIEKLRYANILGRLERVKEQTQAINQAMAELATVPYLQDVSQSDAELLQSLMADATDTLEGSSDGERAWNEIEKV
ncbi:SPT16 protein, partial [Corythaeola cristata]|nr:SPT16 protein [Corythaeola cristata]